MLDSVRNRWFLAIGLAVVAALSMTLCFSTSAKRAEKQAEKSGKDAAAVWKARTGFDLAALPGLHPPHTDSVEARELDALLLPMSIHLGGRQDRPEAADIERDADALAALRDALRDAIRATTTDPKPMPPAVVALIENRAARLDTVAEFVASHRSIAWQEDFGPRPHRSALVTDDHVTLHRLLIARAFLALERGDAVTAKRMFSTSQKLEATLEQRQELFSHLVAVGIERMHLALMRRAGASFGETPAAPEDGVRARFLNGMSNESIVAMNNARQEPFSGPGNDPPERLIRLFAGPKLEAAASQAIVLAAETVGEVVRSQDGCAELAKPRRKPHGMFSDNYYALNAKEAWRRFVVLELDRALTNAVLTGQATSPCRSVTLSVHDDGKVRTVEAKGLPEETESVIGLPSTITTKLDR
jgi:hypothetical protein